MSQSAATTHHNIRLLIDDMNPDARAISRFRMDQIVQSKVQLLAARTHGHLLSAPTGVAMVAGTYDYTLTVTPKNIRQVILNSTGLELAPIGLEEMNAIYKQDTAVPTSSGTPVHYALYENLPSLDASHLADEQVVKMRVGPTPSRNDSLDIYIASQPGVSQGKYASAGTAANDVPFGPLLCVALEKACAAECVLMMDDEDLRRRKLSRGISQAWIAESNALVREENWAQRVRRGLKAVVVRGNG